MKCDRLRFAFIGCGNIAHFHADVIKALGHEIIGLAATPGSPRIFGFAQKYGVKKTYSDYRIMLTELSPDAVILCVSWEQIEKLIAPVAAYGIPVLTEKPAALSSKKISLIMEAVPEHKDKVMVGYNRRFYDFIPMLKNAVTTDKLCSAELILPESAEQLSKKYTPAIREHILLYISSHWLDAASYLLGNLKVLTMRSSRDDNGNVCSYNGLLFAENFNIPVHYQSDFNTPQNIAVKFVFSDAVYLLCPFESLKVFRDMKCLEPTDAIPVRRYEPLLAHVEHTDMRFKPGFFNQMKYFVEHIVKNNNSSSPVGCTLDQALYVTELCEEIKEKAVNSNS